MSADALISKYTDVGLSLIKPQKAFFSNPLGENNIRRALSVLKQFNQVVFVVDSVDESANNLMHQTLDQLRDSENPQEQAFFLDVLGFLKARPTNPKTIIAEITDAMPLIGVIPLSAFRAIEKQAEIASLFRFILCDKIPQSEKRNKKVLIIGATSFLGNALYDIFSQSYAEVVGTGYRNAESQGKGYRELDIKKEDQVKQCFDQDSAFDIVIYVSGEANADLAQKNHERAYALNTEPVNTIAKYFNGKFVYISSEYVFDGKTGPYTSCSKPNPINYYGQTKLDAEVLTFKHFSNALIVRLGALYGYNGPHDKKTTVSGIVANLEKAQSFDIDEIQIKHPILLEDAALTLLRLLDYDAKGIYQANGSVGLNKVELAKQIANVWGETKGCAFSHTIRGNTHTDMAHKPVNTAMVNVDTPRFLQEGMRFMFTKQQALLKQVA